MKGGNEEKSRKAEEKNKMVGQTEEVEGRDMGKFGEREKEEARVMERRKKMR